MKRSLLIFLMTLAACAFSLVTVAPASALSPTSCAINSSVKQRTCYFTNVGLVGSVVNGFVVWRYADALRTVANTGDISLSLKDNYADGDCAVARLAWIPAKGENPQWTYSLGAACGNGTVKPIDTPFGGGLIGVSQNFGYYLIQVGFRNSDGYHFGWTKVWQQHIGINCPC